MDTSASAVLNGIRPSRKTRIIDLVAAAGIDTAPWARKADGSVIANPAANPHYCYEWAFGGKGEPTALCIWHESLKNLNDNLAYEGNLRQEALDLERATEDQFQPAAVKSRAKEQAARARRFDLLLQHAYRRLEPVRVITLLGEQRGGAKPGWQSAKVEYRLLDPEPWYVHVYKDDNGFCRLLRGVVPDDPRIEAARLSFGPIFVDQFSVPSAPQHKESRGLAYSRSAEVRRIVLQRASGKCECCSAPGFVTYSGAIFLETHHAFPLSDGGPDVEWNVVAICPNDHRRAHFGEDRGKLQSTLIARLIGQHPAAENALRELLHTAASR